MIFGNLWLIRDTENFYISYLSKYGSIWLYQK